MVFKRIFIVKNPISHLFNIFFRKNMRDDIVKKMRKGQKKGENNFSRSRQEIFNEMLHRRPCG